MTAAAKPGSLAEALAALQAQMPPVGKHASADVKNKEGRKLYDYAYAPGESITPVLYPLMGALGLSFTSAPDYANGRFTLRYSLLHVSGDSLTGEYPLPDPDRHGPQDLGKAITYARRYALCALVGLFPGGDDNDASDMQHQPRTAEAKRAETRPRAARAGAAHERLVHHDAGHDPAKVQRTKGQRVSGTDDDPWASGRAVDKTTGEVLTDPEDKPGSINPGQHRGIELMLTRQGIGTDDRPARHDVLCTLLGLDELPGHPETGEPSITGLSYSQAADALKMLADHKAAG